MSKKTGKIRTSFGLHQAVSYPDAGVKECQESLESIKNRRDNIKITLNILHQIVDQGYLSYEDGHRALGNCYMDYQRVKAEYKRRKAAK